MRPGSPPYDVTTDVSEVLGAVRARVDSDLPNYSASLGRAFTEVDPVFTRKAYCDFFWHCASTVPGWMAHVILANAEAESHGSAKLMRLWQRVDYNDVAEREIMIHGRDESRHSRIFLDLAGRAFPDVVRPDVLDKLRALPDIRGKVFVKADSRLDEADLIDALVQTNIAEIRTRIHLELFAPLIYASTPVDDRPRVARVLRALARDEVRHIAYTARLMEQWTEDGASNVVHDLYARRLRDFNAITIADAEDAVRAFGQGQFPDLLEV